MSAPRQFVNGQWVHGAAAETHIIKKNGGWNAYHEKIIQDAATKFARQYVQELNKQHRSTMRRVK